MTRRPPDEIATREATRRARIEAEERALRAAEIAGDLWEIFRAVAGRYRAAFGTVPDTWRIDPVRLAPLAEAMEAAMQAGRALTVDQASAVSGCRPLPLGAIG